MSKGFGSRADMLSTRFDEVSRNSIWREHCEKEQATAGLGLQRDFVVTNPFSSAWRGGENGRPPLHPQRELARPCRRAPWR